MPKDKKWSRLPSVSGILQGLQLYNFIKGKSSIFYSICTNFKFMHKVINIIHNICTKFGGIGTFLWMFLWDSPQKHFLFIVSTYLENWLHV